MQIKSKPVINLNELTRTKWLTMCNSEMCGGLKPRRETVNQSDNTITFEISLMQVGQTWLRVLQKQYKPLHLVFLYIIYCGGLKPSTNTNNNWKTTQDFVNILSQISR